MSDYPPWEPYERWRGIVCEVEEDLFIAELIDVSGRQGEREAFIMRDFVAGGERELLRPGAAFEVISQIDRSSRPVVRTWIEFAP